MATGVAPRDEELQFTRSDLETIEEAMKQKKFRDMFKDYFDEVCDPANQALFQKEMTQLEKERGYDVTFINPKGGYVIKTSVAGDRKAFINICSNENVGKPSCKAQEVDGQKGMNWQIPYSLIPPREDYNKKEKIIIYDVVFHPDTLRMARANKQFRDLVNKTAFEGLAKTYDIHLDNNNSRFIRSEYKGMCVPAVIRTEDPNYVPPTDEEIENLSPEMVDKMFPQRNYSESSTVTANEAPKQPEPKPVKTTKPAPPPTASQQKNKTKRATSEFQHTIDNGYTIPKYVIKQQKNVDLQDFTYHKDCKQYTAIPSQIVVEVNMPLLSSTKDCTLDVQEKSLSLKSEKPAKYKLNITLPYCVNDECGSAKFDKSKHKLIVTLPVVRTNIIKSTDTDLNSNSLKVDSGVESENSGDDENCKENLVVELSSTPADPTVELSECPKPREEVFFNSSFGFTLPSYTHNVMDDIVAFTFHVKNTDPDTVKVKKDSNKIFIKFTSVGAGFVPVHYGAIIVFAENVNFQNVTGEAWDNNVILQMELAGEIPQKFQIGLTEDSLITECFDMTHMTNTKKIDSEEIIIHPKEAAATPVVEVTNLGSETNIVVSSTTSEYDEDDDEEIEFPTANDDDVFRSDPKPVDSEATKPILRKPNMIRSYSECSSIGDVASSMDYISSDYIPEESSLKKTVRFSDVIARQFYRYNSSIEGQKKKNQRKKSKKRNQEQRKSESEAEDDVSNLSKVSKPKIKSVLKQRRDSGLADTSDAEVDCVNTSPRFQSSDDSKNGDDQNVKHSEQTENSAENNNEDKEKSVLNIVDNNGNKKADVQPVIWEAEGSESKPSKQTEKEKSEPITCENIKHNTDFYNPDRLNKGQYLEVTFKNDLIFDLDM